MGDCFHEPRFHGVKDRSSVDRFAEAEGPLRRALAEAPDDPSPYNNLNLAGALSVPVWMALQLAPNGRWLLERTDSPWYPSMRLLGQSRFSVWDDVFAEMANQLQSLSAQARVE